MDGASERLNIIDAKVVELNTEKANIERRLMADKELLNDSLIDATIGDARPVKDMDKLRASIAAQERRVAEIEVILAGLAKRRKTEEDRLRTEGAVKVKKALAQIDVECYRAYREELIHNKALAVLKKMHNALQLRRNEELAKLSAIGVDPGLEMFVPVNSRWFEADSKRALSGMNPWEDIDTDDGLKFIDEEITRLEKEVAA